MNNCEHLKDYSKAKKVGYGNDSGSEIYWEWICEECGQIYKEKVREPIDISENQ